MPDMFGMIPQMPASRKHRRRASGQAISAWGAVWILRSGVAAVAVAAFWWNPYQKALVNIWLGVVVLTLALWPLDTWLRERGKRTIPVFPLHLFFYALCFGLAAFIDLPRLPALRLGVDESSYTIGLIAVALGIICLYAGHFMGRRTRGVWLARLAPRFPAHLDKHAALLLYPALLAGSIFLKLVPVSGLEQVILTLRLFCLVWALFAAWSGTLAPKHARVVVFLLLPVEFVLFSGLLQGILAGILIYGELIVVCFVLCKKRVPLLLILGAVLAFALLQPIKHHYREVIWAPGGDSVGTIERVELLAGQTAQGLESGLEDEGWRDRVTDTYSRLHHLSTSSAIIQEVQITHNYWYGETLLPLLSKWIPRAIWSDKPTEDLGNRWAKAYGYLDQADYATSYNLPWLPEMYMNFGWWGIVIISILLGFLMGMLERGIMERVNTPVQFAFAYVLASTFLFPESNMSLMLGGLIVNWIAIALFLWLLRILVKTPRPRSASSVEYS